MDDNSDSKTVVILGAGWAGTSLAHQLLKRTLPKLPGLRVVLVSPNSHFFWNVAAPRGIIPGQIADEELFIPIVAAFEKYPADVFQFVLGAAEAIEYESNCVHVRLGDGDGKLSDDDDSQSVIRYDQLVIATGSRIISNLPFKPVGSYKSHLDSWHTLQQKVETAKTIVVGGGGPTGVEVAGELAAHYGATKEITLVESSESVLYDKIPSVRETAEKDLLKLGVNIIHNNRATQSEGDKTGLIHLSKGGLIKADLFLPVYGVVVNNSFLPDEFLDWEGNLKLDATMRVQGRENIWAAGDVGNIDPKLLAAINGQVKHLETALDTVLTEPEASVSQYGKFTKTAIFFSLGRSRATGQYGNMKVLGFIVSMVKGRKLFLNNASNYVSGKTRQYVA